MCVVVCLRRRPLSDKMLWCAHPPKIPSTFFESTVYDDNTLVSRWDGAALMAWWLGNSVRMDGAGGRTQRIRFSSISLSPLLLHPVKFFLCAITKLNLPLPRLRPTNSFWCQNFFLASCPPRQWCLEESIINSLACSGTLSKSILHKMCLPSDRNDKSQHACGWAGATFA